MMNELEQLISKMVASLRQQVEEKVPETGCFPVVYEREDVSAMPLNLSHLILKVSPTSKTTPVDDRFLELAGVNYPSPYGAETVVGYGSTHDILRKLSEEGFVEALLKRIPKLERDVNE